MAAKKGPKGTLTRKHKAALAQGRAERKVVHDYLQGLRSSKLKRGRKRPADTIKRRLSAIDRELVDADPVRQLKLTQEQLDLYSELGAMDSRADLAALEADFVEIAKNYSDRSGISYAAWREVGVTPRVLAKAGIAR